MSIDSVVAVDQSKQAVEHEWMRELLLNLEQRVQTLEAQVKALQGQTTTSTWGSHAHC